MTTALYAALLALLFCALSINVIRSRRTQRVALGDGNNATLRQAMRAHGNCAEYAPIFLILLGLVEYHGLPFWGVHALGLIFLAGRLFHAYGVGFKERYGEGSVENVKYRVRGMGLTFTAIVSAASILLAQYVMSLVS